MKLIIAKKWQKYVIDNSRNDEEKERWEKWFESNAEEPPQLENDKQTFKEAQQNYRDYVRSKRNNKSNRKW